MTHQLVNASSVRPNLGHGHAIHLKVTRRVKRSIRWMWPAVGLLISKNFVNRPQMSGGRARRPELSLRREVALHRVHQAHEVPDGKHMRFHETSQRLHAVDPLIERMSGQLLSEIKNGIGSRCFSC